MKVQRGAGGPPFSGCFFPMCKRKGLNHFRLFQNLLVEKFVFKRFLTWNLNIQNWNFSSLSFLI